MVKIKICGVTRVEDATAAADCGAHAIGLNFAPESRRFLENMDQARLLAATVHERNLLCAGVFVNAGVDEIFHVALDLQLDIIQLHGEESPEFVSQLRKRVLSVAIWKAVGVAKPEDLAQLYDYETDAWLLDAKTVSMRGGSGKSFDWRILQSLRRFRPIVLAGGLNPGNVLEAVATVQPDWVDTASGVEIAPGVKDRGLICKFCEPLIKYHS